MNNFDDDIGGLVYQIATLFLIAGAFILAGVAYLKKFGHEAKTINNRLHEIQKVTKHINKINVDDKKVKLKKLIESEFVQTIARRIGLNEYLKFLIIRSGVKISEINFLWLVTIVPLAAFAFGYNANFGLVETLIFGTCVGSAPFLYLKYKTNIRQKKIEEQLPGALDFLVRTLQVGYGITSIFSMMGDELEKPISEEFKIVGQEIAFGLPFTEALFNLIRRVDSTDFNFLVVGLLIQRESGGNLISLLQGLGNDMRQKLIFAGKVAILSTEAKYSAMLLVALPFILGVALSFINPEYMSILWTTPTGLTTIKITLGMMSVGMAWMWHMTKIKV